MFVRGKTRVGLVCAVAVLGLGLLPGAASANPPNCVLEATNLFIGGDEPAVPTTAHGVAADAAPRAPALCQHVNGSYESASSGWTMLWTSSDPFSYHQIGWKKTRYDSVGLWFSEWNEGGVPEVRVSSFSPAWGTRYRLVVRKTTAPLWDGYVLLDSDGTIVWNSPNDPTGHSWTPTAAKYAGETWNHSDRIGGTSGSRARLDTLRWYDSSGAIVYASIPASDRFNSYPTEYHSAWGSDLRSFDFWSDY